MSNGLLLDTRSHTSSSRMSIQPPEYSSQIGSAGLLFYRHLVRNLVKSNHRDRASLRKTVIDRLRMSRNPKNDITELLGQCVVDNRSEGLDIAIDVLTHFGGRVIEYAREFWRKDVSRWEANSSSLRQHINDDVWYILLRAAGASSLNVDQKLPMLGYCAKNGTPAIREASIRAIGDMGGDFAIPLLNQIGKSEKSPMVLETIAEVFDDLEA